MRVTKIFEFDSAHYLPQHEGSCQFMHGHRWVCEITFQGDLDRLTGMVIDFKLAKRVVNELIIEPLDHKLLNDVLPFVPTAENISMYIFNKLKFARELKHNNPSVRVYCVKVWESRTSYAECYEEDI